MSQQKLSENARNLLNALRKNIDNELSDIRWGEVYLDNATVEGMNARSKAGYLSALEKAGYYQAEDTYFGLVKLA